MAGHTSVMMNEVLEFLNPLPGGVFLDCTVGGGGHTARILEKVGTGGFVVGLDQDETALEIAAGNLSSFSNLRLIRLNFEDIDQVPAITGISAFDGILFDIGVSSFQLDTVERGFSFQNEARLDMRMDTRNSCTAGHIVNRYSEEQLRDMFFTYGQERDARRIARKIVETRKKSPIMTTTELADLIRSCKRMPSDGYWKTNPATKVFQALRIAVNRELDVLETGLDKATKLLKNGGRICVISFHSLEDRVVKQFFRGHDELERLTKKPVAVSREEILENKRSRSAKLRAAQKNVEVVDV